jgi:hypothetical protein
MVRTTLVAAVVRKDWIKDSRDGRVIKVIVPGTRTMRVRNKELT